MRVSDYLAEDFVGLIKDHRACLGLSRAEMAAEIGVMPSVYSNWERGRAKPNTRTIGRVFDYYGDEFVRLADDPEDSPIVRFDKACLRSGLSKSEVGELIGYSPVSIRDWYRGKVKFDERKCKEAMKKLYEYLSDLYHPDGSPAIIAREKVKEVRELPGGCVELIEFSGRRHVVKAGGRRKQELLGLLEDDE